VPPRESCHGYRQAQDGGEEKPGHHSEASGLRGWTQLDWFGMTQIKLHMPNLSDRNVPIAKYLLPQLLVGGVEDDPFGLLLREFVRLVDKAVFEYEDARGAFETGSENHRYILPHIAFTNHFETCINAVARLLKILDRLVRLHRNAGQLRTIRKMAKAAEKEVRGIRDQIEHMAEDIQKGARAAGDPIMLALSEDGKTARVGDQCIALSEVARAITALHRVALAVLQSGSQTTLPEAI